MEDFLIYNTLGDRKYPDAYKDNYHCHILCRSGEMKFDAVGKTFVAGPGDLVIWQMTTAVSNVHYSADFDADFVLISNPFLNLYNPEQVWATKGYVYIKSHPVFHLENDEWDVIEADFEQFRHCPVCRKALRHPQINPELTTIHVCRLTTVDGNSCIRDFPGEWLSLRQIPS